MNPCGTYAAYRRHRKANEQPCPACRTAAAKYERERRWRARNGIPRDRRRVGGTAARVLDILETVPELWFSADMLDAELAAAGRSVKRTTLDRAVRRLFETDVVERRLVESVVDDATVRGWPAARRLEVRHAG